MSQDGTGATEVDDPNGDIIVDDIPVKVVAKETLPEAVAEARWKRRRRRNGRQAY